LVWNHGNYWLSQFAHDACTGDIDKAENAVGKLKTLMALQERPSVKFLILKKVSSDARILDLVKLSNALSDKLKNSKGSTVVKLPMDNLQQAFDEYKKTDDYTLISLDCPEMENYFASVQALIEDAKNRISDVNSANSSIYQNILAAINENDFSRAELLLDEIRKNDPESTLLPRAQIAIRQAQDAVKLSQEEAKKQKLIYYASWIAGILGALICLRILISVFRRFQQKLNQSH